MRLLRAGFQLNNDFFQFGEKRRPLLVIYPVELKPIRIDNDELDDIKKKKIAEDLGLPLYGISVGIPNNVNASNINIKYKINVVKFKELFEINDNTIDLYDEDEYLEESLYD